MKRGFLPLVPVAALLVLSCSEKSTPPDVTPPDAITDLLVQNNATGILLRWTAPGDDGSKGHAARYDIRVSSGDLASTWESASAIPFTAQPGNPGWMEALVVSPLGFGRWEFGVRTADEVPNWSELSNIAVLTIVAPDTIPPATVMDLSVEAITRSTVTLSWTATGDDGSDGQASSYELRYAQAPITQETWGDATSASGLPLPRSAGGLETFTLTGLETDQEYWFALSVADEAGNRSGVSNVVHAVVTGSYQLTFVQTVFGAGQPDWSPDGGSIAFVQYIANTPEWSRPEIHVISLDGGNARQYTFLPPEGAQSPRWSPDGSRFFFIRMTEVYPYTVGYLAVVDAEPHAEPIVLLDSGLRNVRHLALSRDGTRLAYVLFDPPSGTMPTLTGDLFTNSATGDDPVLLLEEVRIAGLDLSPDGSELVIALRQDDVYNLHRMPSTGGVSVALTSGPDDKGRPAWSPDGSEIAYSSAGSFWAVPAAGGEPRRLLQDSTGEGSWGLSLAWSPDGTRVAYEKTVGGVRNIWVSTVE